MYTLYRRHEKKRQDGTPGCKHAAKGRHYDKCNCPIWISDGAKFRQSLKTRDLVQARVHLNRLNSDGAPAQDSRRCSPKLLTEAIETYVAACEGSGRAPGTIVCYRSVLSALTRHFPASTMVSDIDTDAMEEFRKARQRVDGKAGKHLTLSTQRKELTIARMFFRYAKGRKWATENPASEVMSPIGKAPRKIPFSAVAIDAIIQAVAKLGGGRAGEQVEYWRVRALALVLTFLYSGLRISDIAKLRRDELDLTTREISVYQKKTDGFVQIQLPPEAITALSALPIESEYFFWNGKSQLRSAIGAIYTTIRTLLELAGVEGGHPHRFRRTFATRLLTNGRDIYDVQQLLGHSSVATTLLYTPRMPETQKRLNAATATLDFVGHSDSQPPNNAQENTLRDAKHNVLSFSGPRTARRA